MLGGFNIHFKTKIFYFIELNPYIQYLLSIYNNDEEKLGSVRRYFCNSISPTVNTYTLEASLLGYVPDPASDEAPPPGTPIDPKNPRGIVPYSDESYCRIGRNVARAMWDYYKILGVIPLEGNCLDFFRRR